MVAAVNGKGSGFDVGAVQSMSGMRAAFGVRYPYGVSANGQRFLINTVREQRTSEPITVVVNWTEGLKK